MALPSLEKYTYTIDPLTVTRTELIQHIVKTMRNGSEDRSELLGSLIIKSRAMGKDADELQTLLLLMRERKCSLMSLVQKEPEYEEKVRSVKHSPSHSGSDALIRYLAEQGYPEFMLELGRQHLAKKDNVSYILYAEAAIRFGIPEERVGSYPRLRDFQPRCLFEAIWEPLSNGQEYSQKFIVFFRPYAAYLVSRLCTMDDIVFLTRVTTKGHCIYDILNDTCWLATMWFTSSLRMVLDHIKDLKQEITEEKDVVAAGVVKAKPE